MIFFKILIYVCLEYNGEVILYMEYLKLIRVKHYLKNFLVFLPAIFSGTLFNQGILFKALIMFLSFSFVASIIYVINDLKDVENDKKHPIKKNRPIASGKVSKKAAIITILILLILTFILLYCIHLLFDFSTLILLIYFFMNICYSFGLKNVPLVDITILALGFVLRVVYGGIGLDIELSNWLFLTVLSVSFYMALGKRRNELLKNGKSSRKALSNYNKNFLDKSMYMFLSLTIVFYSLWAISVFNNSFFKYSVILIIVILLKYCMDVESDNFGDPIDVITHDNILMILGVIYVLFVLIIFYV